MNTVTDLLARVHDYGAALLPAPADYRVQIHPPASLPDSLLAELKKHKPQILAYLRQCSFYRFRLQGGRRGIYRTLTMCLEAARAELAKVYGDRLVVVAQA